MGQAKSVAHGFLDMASAICLFVIAGWLIFYLNPWVGLALFLFLAIPFSIRSVLVLKGLTEKKSAQTRVRQAKSVLMALQGVGFACWFLDVISTIFTININQTGSELNPLGWPFSAVAALAYYIPITFVIYYLLYKIKSKESFYGAVILTAVTLFMSARNLNAGLHNFSRVGSFTSSTAELEALCIWLAIVVALGTFNIIVILRNGAWNQNKLIVNDSCTRASAGVSFNLFPFAWWLIVCFILGPIMSGLVDYLIYKRRALQNRIL